MIQKSSDTSAQPAARPTATIAVSILHVGTAPIANRSGISPQNLASAAAVKAEKTHGTSAA